MKYCWFLLAILILSGLNSCHKSQMVETSKISYVDFTQVKLTDDFWAPKIKRNMEVTIPHNILMCEEVGAVRNFEIVAGLKRGDYTGLINWDAFLYKTIEAASYSLMMKYDKTLDTKLDELIDIISAAQEEDGYLRTYISIGNQKNDPEIEGKWENLKNRLELYCAGHLIEAAIAHKMATGKDRLFEVAIRLADLIDQTFGYGKNMGIPGHQQIELSLARLYEFTGEIRYLKLAKFFVDERGNAKGHKLYGEFSQDHMPFLQQTEAVGQAPRATYFYSGAADVAYHYPDSTYFPTLKTLWQDIVDKKMYINGGIGSHHKNEGFGKPYDLPNLTAYTEICAAISFSMWNSRMFKLDSRSDYFDLIERTLYNNFIAGVNTEGNQYFYACPTESDGQYAFNLGWYPGGELPYRAAKATRKTWFPCACCPPNLARYIHLIPGLIYAHTDQDLMVNLYIANQASMRVGPHQIGLKMNENYLEHGTVNLELDLPQRTRFNLKLRLPGWSHNRPVPGDLYHYQNKLQLQPTILVNGKPPLRLSINNGYAVINRSWKPGDKVSLEFPLEVRRVRSHDSLQENRGKVALERGPILYCVEGVDNQISIESIDLSEDTQFNLVSDPVLPWKDLVLKGISNNQYGDRIEFTAIPYYLWSNRGPTSMRVWLDSPNI